MSAFRKYLAEFIGTFVLVAFACGTAIITGCGIEGGWLMTALAFGLVIVAMAYSIGNISGCHINPAVSIAMLISKKLTFKDFIGYVIAQFAGGLAGAGIISIYASPSNTTHGFATNGLVQVSETLPFNNAGIAVTILAEIILTFVFVLAILGVTSKKEYASVAGIVIGLTLTLVHIIGIGLTGTSVNPARSFGVALLAGGEALKNVWIFIVAPLAGGALAAVTWKFLSCEKKKKK